MGWNENILRLSQILQSSYVLIYFTLKSYMLYQRRGPFLERPDNLSGP